MSTREANGTLDADGSTTEILCTGWCTLWAIGDFGGGTLTWQHKGMDGAWRSIYSGSTGETEQAFTANHMQNAFFGNDTHVRGTLDGSTSPDLDWEIRGNPANRGSAN
jgi:hypothetical protein